MRMLRFHRMVLPLVLTLSACEQAPKYDRVIVNGPDHGRIVPVSQEIDLLRPPSGYLAPRWKPGDPTIDPGDLRSDRGVQVGAHHESWFRRWLRRICCTIFSCKPKPPDKPPNPTGVSGADSFNGIPGTRFIVPDPVGDVGFDHYIQAVNSAFQVFTRTGSSVTDPLSINVLWYQVDGPCGKEDIKDPIVRFDSRADRWLISGFVWEIADPDALCIAVSQSSDPVTGGWYLYTLPALDGIAGDKFSLDFPKLSVWSDAYFLSSLRGEAGDTPLGLDAWALDRSKMITGSTAGFTRFHITGPQVALLPADPDGPSPPDNSPGWFARQIDGERFSGTDRIEIWAFAIDWANYTNASFALIDELQTDPFDSVLCDTSLRDPCVPQPGTPQLLETLGAWPQWRLQYRNLGEEEALLFNHTIDIDGMGHAGIRWYQLRRPLAGAWSLSQQGNHFSAEDHFFMGSIAMDNKGNIALGYSAAGSSEHPSINIAHRKAGDAPGMMPGAEYIAVTGTGSQLQENERWGNYSTMDVDPTDDCTFWYTHEYYETSTEAGWSTAIVNFQLEGCGN